MAPGQANPSATAAQKLIESCPTWTGTGQNDTQRKAAIMRHLQDLRQFNLPTLREGLRRFVEEREITRTYDLDAMCKLFLLNRYVFDVPQWVPREQSVAFGAWMGIPEEDSRINVLWPLAVNGAGHLELAGRNIGYLGADFRALDEFDYFAKQYGPREKY
jgi:hypothetical protein